MINKYNILYFSVMTGQLYEEEQLHLPHGQKSVQHDIILKLKKIVTLRDILNL